MTNSKTVLKTILIIALVIIVCNNFFTVLNTLNTLLNKWDIRIYAIEKTLRLNAARDITNGRGDIIKYTIQEIMKSPIWGHGIATIYNNSYHKIIYPHNFILQLFYDGGILLAIPTLFVLIKVIIFSVFSKNKDKAILGLFFVAVCVPKMFFSTDIWNNAEFWIFLVYAMNHRLTSLKFETQQEDESYDK